jgi:hypothetical protein
MSMYVKVLLKLYWEHKNLASNIFFGVAGIRHGLSLAAGLSRASQADEGLAYGLWRLSAVAASG